MIKSLKIGLLFLMMACSALAEQRVICISVRYDQSQLPDMSSVNALLAKGWKVVKMAVSSYSRSIFIFVLESPAPTKP